MVKYLKDKYKIKTPLTNETKYRGTILYCLRDVGYFALFFYLVISPFRSDKANINEGNEALDVIKKWS